MNKELKYWYLHNHHIFSKLKPEELKSLEVQVGFIKAKKGETIQLIEGPVKRIYFLKQGLLKIVRNEGGSEKVVDIIVKDDIFGEIIGITNAKVFPEFAQVVSSEAVICTFTLDDFEKVLAKNPSLCIEYSKKLGEKILKLERKYNNLIFKDTKSRLKDFLKELAQGHGKIESDFVTIQLNLTHQEIADLIGCQRQTISVLMNELKAENKLEYSRSSFRIPNLSYL